MGDKMFKAVVTDLDGTLLDKNHFLSPYTKDVLNRFLQKGYKLYICLLYTSPSPRDRQKSRMPSSA